MMYSPKIREDLIPALYHMGKEQQKPMTKVVDEIIRQYIINEPKYSKMVEDNRKLNGKKGFSKLEKKVYCLDELG